MNELLLAALGIAASLRVAIDDAEDDGVETVEIRTSLAKAKALMAAIDALEAQQ